MSTSLQPFHKPPEQGVLGELLHSLSQPLTSLRCSLELSIDEAAGQQQEAVVAALEQADRVVGLVKLMRDYLDTEPDAPPPQPVPFTLALCEVVDQLRSVAVLRQIRLQLVGRSEITLPVSEPRLRLALQYLIGSMVEAQPVNREITLRCEEDDSEFILRAQVRSGSRRDAVAPLSPGSIPDPFGATLRRAKLAIASRMFESGGASLAFDGGDLSGFVLRIPRKLASPR